MKLKGKVAIITGGGRGIGRCIARKLAKREVTLAITSRTESQLVEVYNELNKFTEIFYKSLDIRKEKEVKKFINEVVRKYKRIDILINNAGYVKPLSLLETTLRDWKAQIDTNLTGTFLMTREVVKHMKNYGGKIVNIA